MRKYLRLSAAFISFFVSLTLANAGPRTEVHVSPKTRAKMKDLTRTLDMATITPVVDRNDEVICMEIGSFKEPLIRQELKAEEGDCISEVRVYKKTADGKTTNQIISVLSPLASMQLFQELQGASRVDVDLKRKKKIVPMTYLMN